MRSFYPISALTVVFEESLMIVEIIPFTVIFFGHNDHSRTASSFLYVKF